MRPDLSSTTFPLQLLILVFLGVVLRTIINFFLKEEDVSVRMLYNDRFVTYAFFFFLLAKIAQVTSPSRFYYQQQKVKRKRKL